MMWEAKFLVMEIKLCEPGSGIGEEQREETRPQRQFHSYNLKIKCMSLGIIGILLCCIAA